MTGHVDFRLGDVCHSGQHLENCVAAGLCASLALRKGPERVLDCMPGIWKSMNRLLQAVKNTKFGGYRV